jgi:hypothetical protein
MEGIMNLEAVAKDRNYPYRQIRQLLREHRRNIEADDDLE